MPPLRAEGRIDPQVGEVEDGAQEEGQLMDSYMEGLEREELEGCRLDAYMERIENEVMYTGRGAKQLWEMARTSLQLQREEAAVVRRAMQHKRVILAKWSRFSKLFWREWKLNCIIDWWRSECRLKDHQQLVCVQTPPVGMAPIAIMGITRRGWPHRNKAFIEHIFALREGEGHATYMIVEAMKLWEEAGELHLIVSRLDALERARSRVYGGLGANPVVTGGIYEINEDEEQYRIAKRGEVLKREREMGVQIGIWDGVGAIKHIEAQEKVKQLIKAADVRQKWDQPGEKYSARRKLERAERIIVLFGDAEEGTGRRRAKRRKA